MPERAARKINYIYIYIYIIEGVVHSASIFVLCKSKTFEEIMIDEKQIHENNVLVHN